MSPDETTTPTRGAHGPEQLRASLRRLADVLSGVAETADRSVRERCPHRAARSRCHYAHACRNQRRIAGALACAEDAVVRSNQEPR